MKIERIIDNLRYTFSNKNLKIGDKVYPIANGRCLDNDGWILHEFDFDDINYNGLSNFHTILNLKHSTEYKPYEIQTDHGFGPKEIYYKIIKTEKQIKESEKKFAPWIWVEIN